MQCRFCKSQKIKKNGFRITKTRGKIQTYACLKCGRRFVNQVMITGMKNRRWKIKQAIKLRDQGYSLAEIRRQVGEVSRATLLNWFKEFRTPRKKIVRLEVDMQNQYKPYKRIFRIRI